MRILFCLMTLLLIHTNVIAQEKEKKGGTISYGDGGLRVSDNKKMKKDRSVEVTFASVDVGFNTLIDNTDYTNPAAKNFLKVPQNLQNSNLFDLRTGKSMNVNIWPVMGRGRLVKTKHQKIYISTGVGLQVYNFRYNGDIDYVPNIPTGTTILPGITWDSVTDLRKNKLVVTYLSVPLNITFKTKMAHKLWLVYGVGITGGYRISSYTKQVSGMYGKKREHGNFNLEDFNSTVTAEFGLDNYFRLYASYQLTNMYKDVSGLDQQPFCIGLRFGGI